MPIYEYQCALCHHHLEVLQKMQDAPLTECPKCQKSGLQRLVSAAGFQFKGSGWYATDYSNKGKVKESDAKGKESDVTDTKSSKGEDSSKEKKDTQPTQPTVKENSKINADTKTGGSHDDG